MNHWLIPLLVATLCFSAACGSPALQPSASPPQAVATSPTPASATATHPPAVKPTTVVPTTAARPDPMQATDEPAARAEPPAGPSSEAETVPETETDWLSVEGKTVDNFTYLGNPAAPVTIIDYSDFL